MDRKHMFRRGEKKKNTTCVVIRYPPKKNNNKQTKQTNKQKNTHTQKQQQQQQQQNLYVVAGTRSPVIVEYVHTQQSSLITRTPASQPASHVQALQAGSLAGHWVMDPLWTGPCRRTGFLPPRTAHRLQAH